MALCRERCLEQQMEMMHGHVRHLTDQLSERGEELADLRHSTSSRLLNLENQLQIKTDQVGSQAAGKLRIVLWRNPYNLGFRKPNFMPLIVETLIMIILSSIGGVYYIYQQLF